MIHFVQLLKKKEEGREGGREGVSMSKERSCT